MNDSLRIILSELTRLSASIILPYYMNPELKVDTKTNQTPVTIADTQAEVVMREFLEHRFPQHGIIGEEYGSVRTDAEYVWTLDPIDGTISFTTGCPLFGTLIGLLHHGKPVLGAIHQPVLNQLMIGDGKQTRLNDRAVHMRKVDSLASATLLATDVSAIEKYHSATGLMNLRQSSALFRTWGDCYGYLLLAGGWADIMLDARMNIWDVVPLVPIIQGAGGVITSWDGGDAATGNSCIAAAQHLHARVLEILHC